ncbi:MAG: hypothetical protein A2X86_09360 [Bdellovibrionales bacterium GWA2_49_15]|nr:MAG: hypothetical protein A2X86_09360 [Bdellovibrionales bacterium GWA2_49_15]
MKSGIVKGKVQGVMFRQTFIRALLKRQLLGGVSNDPREHDRVSFTIQGDEQKISEVLERLISVVPLNSWGASVTHLELLGAAIPIEQHQVTTANVDNFRWTQSVEFYL